MKNFIYVFTILVISSCETTACQTASNGGNGTVEVKRAHKTD